jgi:hypothetical protein
MQNWVVVQFEKMQFEKRLVSGYRFSDAASASILNGFSRWGLMVQLQRQKPVS